MLIAEFGGRQVGDASHQGVGKTPAQKRLQDLGPVSNAPAGGVIARIRQDDRLSRKPLRLIDELGDGSHRYAELKILAGIPILPSELKGFFFKRRPFGSCQNYAGGGARLVSPHVPDQQGSVQYSGFRIHRWQSGIKPFSGLVFGTGSLPRQEHGNGRPDHSGPNPLRGAVHQKMASALHGLLNVDMRRVR